MIVTVLIMTIGNNDSNCIDNGDDGHSVSSAVARKRLLSKEVIMLKVVIVNGLQCIDSDIIRIRRVLFILGWS